MDEWGQIVQEAKAHPVAPTGRKEELEETQLLSNK
jgi:hypothetical protein